MNNCYCGHPEKSHELQGPREYKPCLHCQCRGYVEFQETKVSHVNPNCLDPTRCNLHGEDGPVSYQETKASEEVLLGVDSGPEGTCKLYGYRKDGVVHVTREEYSKPQEEPKETLKMGSVFGGKVEIPLYNPEWKSGPEKETEPKEEEFLKYLHIEPPAIIEGGRSYYLKEEIIKAFRQFIKSQQ